MNNDKFVTAPQMREQTRNEIAIITKMMNLERTADTYDLLIKIFSLLQNGNNFKSEEEILSFVELMTADKGYLLSELSFYRTKLQVLQHELKKLIE